MQTDQKDELLAAIVTTPQPGQVLTPVRFRLPYAQQPSVQLIDLSLLSANTAAALQSAHNSANKASADACTQTPSVHTSRQLIVRPWVNHSKTTIGYIDDEGKFVALADCSVGPDFASTYEAWARVLSVAPELLDCTKGFVELLLLCSRDKDGIQRDRVQSRAGSLVSVAASIKKAQAVIAKATGGAA